MNPTYVGTTFSGANAASVTRTPAAGNDLILQILGFSSSGDTPTVTDSTGATVIADFPFATGIGVYRVHNATAVAHTLSVSWSTNPSNWFLTLNEAANIAGVDTAAGTPAVATGTSATPTTNSLAPPASGDLLFAAIGINHFLTSLGSLTNGFTETEGNVSGPSYIEAYLSQPSAGSVNCGATANSSEPWSALLIAYVGPITDLTLSPTTLPGGTAEQAYSETITASGGTPPYSFTVTAGSLPPGLTLSTGGVLSGTPTTPGTYSFTVKATDTESDSGTQPYTGVTIVAPTITLSPSGVSQGTVLVLFSQQFSASGGVSPYTYTVSAGSLPPGLSLSSAGLLSGTSTTAGTSAVTIEATDANGYTGTQTCTIVMAPYAPPAGLVYVVLLNVKRAGSFPGLADGNLLELGGNSTGTAPVPPGVGANSDGTIAFGSSYTGAPVWARIYDQVAAQWGAWMPCFGGRRPTPADVTPGSMF